MNDFVVFFSDKSKFVTFLSRRKWGILEEYFTTFFLLILFNCLISLTDVFLSQFHKNKIIMKTVKNKVFLPVSDSQASTFPLQSQSMQDAKRPPRVGSPVRTIRSLQETLG